MKILNIILCLAIFKMTVGSINGQNTNQKKMDSLIESYTNLTDKKNDYNIEFIENKNTLIFNFKTESSREIGYKAILTDINPLGVFLFESDKKTFIRILSIDSGHRFIKQNINYSNTTNVIDIELPKNVNLEKANKVIESLKSILVKPEKESDDIQIITSKSKKGN
jgi:hypothetical protein